MTHRERQRLGELEFGSRLRKLQLLHTGNINLPLGKTNTLYLGFVSFSDYSPLCWVWAGCSSLRWLSWITLTTAAAVRLRAAWSFWRGWRWNVWGGGWGALSRCCLCTLLPCLLRCDLQLLNSRRRNTLTLLSPPQLAQLSLSIVLRHLLKQLIRLQRKIKAKVLNINLLPWWHVWGEKSVVSYLHTCETLNIWQTENLFVERTKKRNMLLMKRNKEDVGFNVFFFIWMCKSNFFSFLFLVNVTFFLSVYFVERLNSLLLYVCKKKKIRSNHPCSFKSANTKNKNTTIL